jgi:hypothetical protein
MAIFTKAEDLFELFGQSVGGDVIEGGQPGYETRRFFQPKVGLDAIVKNPTYLNTTEDEYPTDVVTYSDRRQILGTITLNNRDWWENSNYDKTSFQPYLTDDKKIVFNQQVIEDGNGDKIIVNEDRDKSDFFKFSIDAAPFVINPNTDEIVRLDRYYDKDIDTEKYNLATEGKINYYIYPRSDARTPAGNIDTFKSKGKKTDAGENAFDRYARNPNSTRGYHLFHLDWGDGTPLEHIRETKVLEGNTLLEHVYEKPGFYTIKGVVMAFDGSKIGCWEKFETNFLLNPSPNYDVDLYDYENFATIGGISSNSVLVKSATDIIGINPLTFDDEKSSVKLVENINLLDRLNLYNFLTKIDHTILNKYLSDFDDYTKEITDEPGPMMMDGEIIGCLDPQALNYDPNAERDITVGSICDYGLTLRIVAPNLGSDAPNFHIDLYLVTDEEGMLGSIPEDEPYYLDSPKVLQGQFNVSNPNGYDGTLTLPIGAQNPFYVIGRKLAYQQALGEDWINYDTIDNNSTKKTVQTNPTNSSNKTTNITKSQLLNAKRILIGVRVPETGGGQGSQTTVAVESFSFDVEAVPHSSEDAQALGRNLPILSSNNVNNIYDNVSSNRSGDPYEIQYSTYVHPTLGNISLRNTMIGDGGYLTGWFYKPGQQLPVNEFGNRQRTGVASDWIITKDKMNFLELDISELQDAGATVDNGLNGTYNINFNLTYTQSGGGSTGNITEP